MNSENNSTDNSDQKRQPIFLLPKAVTILAMLLIVIHIAFEYGLDHDGQLLIWLWFGMIPTRFIDPTIAGGMLPLLWTPATHALLHGSWTHLLFNVVWLAIFGTPVARRYGPFWFYIVFFAGAIGGALFYTVLQLDQTSVLIGASGGVAALTGAAMRFVFEPIEVARNPQSGEVVAMGRRLVSVAGVFSNSRARAFTLFWIGFNLAIPIYGTIVGSEGPSIAWQAHIGGFLVGFLLPSLIERGKNS
ncbi:MAG: rhomboid family intramembrane serine protease [Devosiaceae bacterium]|nr:rhomboid family intramembrane serine protease [Devosiaceae bacterium]